MAELAYIKKPDGASGVILKYIDRLYSESARENLAFSIYSDRKQCKGWDVELVRQYRHFRESKFFIAPPGPNISAHIFAMYDTAFGSMKTKSLMYDMIEFSRSIREFHSLAYSLPRVAKRWHPEEVEDIVYNHLAKRTITRADVGLPEEGDYHPTPEHIYDQSRYIGISCLSNYPSQKNYDMILSYADSDIKDLKEHAEKYAKIVRDKMSEMQ